MRAVVLWSGGKDCTMALAEARREHEIVELVATTSVEHGRVTMHGVRDELVRRQADALGLPLRMVPMSSLISCPDYRARMVGTLREAKSRGVEAVVSGDLFLEEVRAYRESILAEVGLTGLYPLWGRDTSALARAFVDVGWRATLACVDGQALDGSFAGRAYDHALLDDLPAGIDPCGENGEFHTFVHDGPDFRRSVPVALGERVTREGRFHYVDLVLPAAERDQKGIAEQH